MPNSLLLVKLLLPQAVTKRPGKTILLPGLLFPCYHLDDEDTLIPGYSASPGWDAVTGPGSPNVANLLPDLIAAAH